MAKQYWPGMILVLLLATWMGARQLDADGLWFDEWWSLYVAGADVFEVSRAPHAIWQRIVAEDVRQGPLYPYLLAGWGSLTGWSLFATRALSLFAGLIALAAVFRLGRAWSKEPLVGLGAAALLATSVWFIYFLHEMRVYMLLVMFTALLLLLYHRVMAWGREPRLLDYVALALVTGLLLNTHYFAGFVLLVLGIWHLARLLATRPDRRWWGVMAAWSAATLLLIPWASNLSLAVEIARSEPRVQADAALLWQIAGDTFYVFSNANIGLLALLLVFSLRCSAARRLWLLLLALLPLNLAAYYAFGLNELRYNMALLPLLALIAAFGLWQLAQRRVIPLLIVAIWFFGGLGVEGDFAMLRRIQRWPGQPIREMAQVLSGRVQPEDVIINLISDENRPSLALHPLVYYLGEAGVRIEVVENTTYPGVQHFARRLREALGDAPHVWLLYDPRWASSEWSLFEYLLNEQSFYACDTLAQNESMLVRSYGRLSSAAPQWHFGEGITVSLISAPRTGSGRLHFWLGFRVGDAVTPGIYSIALHLLDAQGQLQAQADRSLPGAGATCHYQEMVLRPGDYRLNLAVYNWQTGERLPAVTPEGLESDYPLLAALDLTEPE